MVEALKVSKSYRNIKALCEVSFSLGTGVYGLVGENGAGKTTVMKILTRQTELDSGEILYQGRAWDDKCKMKLGYLPQNFEFFENLTLLEALEYLMLVRGEDPESFRDELVMWLEYLNLTGHTSEKIKKLSGGMRQRVGIAQAFLGNPGIVLLDEPTVGLDPKERLAFRNMVNEVCDNKTILISTHILDDIESSCERMICLKNGVVTYEGRVKDFVEGTKCGIYTVALSRGDLAKIGKEICVIAVKREGDMVTVRFAVRDRELLKVNPIYPGKSFKRAVMTLEDAYFLNMYILGKKVQ